MLGGINLEIPKGKIVAIFGPNGSGKSTLLNIVSSTDTDYQGSIELGASSDGTHNTSYMFQSYRDTLFHWRTGWNNILLPIEIKDIDEVGKYKSFIHQISPGILQKIDLDQFPYTYSGGQQQMVAFLRTLVTKPNLILIDEPFSALDYENNLYMRDCLLRYHSKYKPTVVFVTHSIEEAVHLADIIVVLSKKPTVVSAVIHNEHGQKKDIDFIASPYFNQTKDLVLKSFKEVTR